MKKILFYSIMLLIPLSLWAQKTIYTTPVKATQPIVNQNVVKPAAAQFLGEVKAPDQITATDVNVERVWGYYSYYFTCNPFVYEPISKTTLFISNLDTNALASDQELTGRINLKYSTNFGASWSPRRTLVSAYGNYPAWTSIGVTNPTNSTNPADLEYMTYSFLFQWSATNPDGPNYYRAGGFFGNFRPDGSYDTITIAGTDEDPNLQWSNAMVLGDYRGGQSNFYTYGTLDPIVGNNFCYGINRTFDFYKNPPQWSGSHFVQSTTPNSYYNMSMYMDKDPNGNLYAIVDDRFLPPVDADTSRVPGVTKSVDQGNTWSNFDPMPPSLISDFNLTHGNYPNFFIEPYIQEGMAVTGTDDVHFVITLILYDDVAQTSDAYIVEAAKIGSTWQPLKEVSLLSPYFPITIHASSVNNVDTLSRNNNGWELQLAKTADNQYLVAKWIDNNGDSVVFTPAITVGQYTETSLLTTDVYMAFRKLDSPTWSAVLNVTNNIAYDKMTLIPQIVNSITEVPLIRTATLTSADNTYYRYTYPASEMQFVTDYWQQVITSSEPVNLTKTGVEYQPEPASSFKLGDVYPNPASGTVHIEFSSDSPAHATLELFNALGQKVQDLYNDNLNMGSYYSSLNTDELPIGAYYYKLTVGARSITKILTVVR